MEKATTTRKSTMVIKVAAGKIYADVLSKLRKEVDPDRGVANVRPTRKGNLIKIRCYFYKEAFNAEVTKTIVLGGTGESTHEASKQ